MYTCCGSKEIVVTDSSRFETNQDGEIIVLNSGRGTGRRLEHQPRPKPHPNNLQPISEERHPSGHKPDIMHFDSMSLSNKEKFNENTRNGNLQNLSSPNYDDLSKYIYKSIESEHSIPNTLIEKMQYQYVSRKK